MTNYGWECPRCFKIHSPFSLTCDCPPKTFTTTGDTSTAPEFKYEYDDRQRLNIYIVFYKMMNGLNTKYFDYPIIAVDPEEARAIFNVLFTGRPVEITKIEKQVYSIPNM